MRLVNRLDTLRTQPHWATQVMSRQEEGPETLFVAQETETADSDAHQCIATSIPRSLVTPGPTMNMSPFIRGFQDNMTSWMNSLINQQDGCLQMIARQASQG